ncbi:MAG: [Treponema sp.]|nr:[FeFe] hydrogenase H-cluster maturation GTPase HydF [Treponema sp.]
MIQRTTIAFFGRTNAGKSLLVNAVTNQNTSIVSDIKGTTTDPVKKVMELQPLGPVTIIDTPGLDDDTALSKERIKKTEEVLNATQIAVLVIDSTDREPLSPLEKKLIKTFDEKQIPYIIACNKMDLLDSCPAPASSATENTSVQGALYVSALTKENINLLKDKIATLACASKNPKPLVKDIVIQGGTVILVIPIDEAAPKDRLILPQQMVLRELLEEGIPAFCCTPESLSKTLASLSTPPSLVITDSQAFESVNKILAPSIPLTSFSILMARFKGSLEQCLDGAASLDSLCDGDKILISEGCTHHRQCGDIGSVKLPAWISACSGKKLSFEFTSGKDFPSDLSDFRLVVHCGACMLNENEMKNRILRCIEQKVPVTNYGMAIAKTKGILDRSLEPLNLPREAK